MAQINKGNGELHDKKWGSELWLENCAEYCGKLLRFSLSSGSTSMHFHSKKLETMYLLQGKLLIQLIDPETSERYEITLMPGEKIQIPRNQPHRLLAVEDETHVIEFSTHHEDSDSYRVWR